MLTALEGYYNGVHIVTDEQIALQKGQRVIITILDPAVKHEKKKSVDLRKYMGRGEKLFHGEVNEVVRELRSNDRL